MYTLQLLLVQRRLAHDVHICYLFLWIITEPLYLELLIYILKLLE